VFPRCECRMTFDQFRQEKRFVLYLCQIMQKSHVNQRKVKISRLSCQPTLIHFSSATRNPQGGMLPPSNGKMHSIQRAKYFWNGSTSKNAQVHTSWKALFFDPENNIKGPRLATTISSGLQYSFSRGDSALFTRYFS